MNSSKGNASATVREIGRIEHEQSQQAALEWARRWQEGEAQCPRCADTDFELVDTRAEGRMRYETYECRAATCRASWKVEFRETALVVVENARDEANWIELFDEQTSDAKGGH